MTAEIIRKDFTVVRFRRPDGSQYWQCTWVWKSPEAAQRAARFRPAVYKAQFDQFSPEVHKLWRAELKLWQDWGFIRQVNREELRSSITLILISQPHKSSTPVRPVLDFKPVNSGLVSYPNETGHVTCGATLRRWRAGYSNAGRLTESWVLMDIKKAYMCIHMHPECSIYQGITLIEDDGSRTYWELTRLAFGVSIAPKVLRSVIDFILAEAGIDGGVEPYFDDLRVPKSQLDNVVKALEQNGFSLKEPEEAETARILGLQRISGNMWTRRSPLGPIQGETYHHLKSWVATLACSHYPVLRWLRPAARGLERIAHLENPSASKSTHLSQNILRKCEALHRDISSRGDPATGKFTVDAGSTWRLYCDASDLGLGACLYFGSTYVKDVSWLRKLGDIRPIDVVELEAVLKGLNTLVLSWRRALGMTGKQSIEVYTDNRPVLGQLQRKLASHWHSSKGLTAGSAEARLQMIEDTIEVSGLSVSYHYVESERNPADHLTRVPTYLRWKKPSRRSPAPQLAAPAILADQKESWREASQANADGLHIPDSHLVEFLTEVHNDHHEGSEGLFNRLRGWVRAPGLRAQCRRTLQQCATCRASKAHPHQNSDGLQVDSDGIGRKRSRTPAEIADTRRSAVPFNKLHLNIVGPFRKVNDRPQFYVITCICNATGYALGKPVRSTPVGKDVIELLSHIFATFHTHPLVLCTDGGSNLVSGQVTDFLMGFDILPQITAKNTSLSNGRIERLHRTMEEYLRSHVRCDQIAYGVFHRTVAEFLRMYNTTPLRGGKSAHDKVFTFPANCDRFRPVQTRPEYDLLCKDPRETWGPGFLVDSPVLLRVMRPTNKLSRRWVPATIADRLGKKTYSLVGMPGKFDLKDLKPLADSRFGDP